MFDDRKHILGTADAPNALIKIVAEMMHKHGPDRHTDGCEIIAEAAYQWCLKNIEASPPDA